jgi:hypothetical protein
MVGGVIGASISLAVICQHEIAEFYVYGLGRKSDVIYNYSPGLDTIIRLVGGVVVGFIAGMIGKSARSPRMAAWLGFGFGLALSMICSIDRAGFGSSRLATWSCAGGNAAVGGVHASRVSTGALMWHRKL